MLGYPRLNRPVLAAPLALLLAACSGEGEATATLPGGGVVVMSVGSMFGLGGDWVRALAVGSAHDVATTDLVDDTGWWRGSNLYLHGSGVFVLHEGQAGCIAFRPVPAAFVAAPEGACEKTAPPARAGRAGGPPPSRFYAGLDYLGRFAETQDKEAPIRFIPAAEEPEPELPDIL
ncbi:MAG: hypothetical protein ACK5MQ_15790 [Pikeienuella sp.]